MNEELKIIIKAVTQSAQEEINKLKQEIERLSKNAKESGGKMSAAFKGMAKGAAIAVAAVAAIGAALVALGKNTLQFQKEQARLNAAFEAAGSSAEQAAESYNGLYRFLGDTGKASEAAAHLAKITTNQQHLAEWTKISQGIYATFGDSLPIEGLTEAANETLRVGQVTGTLADALNWAGVSEDDFNAKLATTSSLEEREALLRSTLNGLYSEAAEIYERNNGALLAYNESQARLYSTMAAAGAATMPLLTALNNLGSAFFTALKPALDAIIPPIATFINWIAQAIQSVMSFFSALTGKSSTVKAVGEIGKSMAGAAQGAQKLGSGMKGAEKATDGVAKAAEEAKKSTQGFDELNIVSSGSSSSGSSGGGGGGSSSPGYAAGGSGLLNPAAFSTEVEESESLASSLVENIKETFSQLAEVFAPTIEAWSGAFETVKESWNTAKPDFINGISEIQTGFTTLGEYLGTEFVPNVVNSFSENLAPVVGDTFGFIIEETGKQFSWLGGYINTTINDVAIPALQTIEMVATDIFNIIGGAWDEHGATLLEAFSGFFEKIRGHFDNFYKKVFKPIWDNVLKVFDNVWKKGIKPLVETFVDAILTISTELLTLYNKVIAPIVDWIIQNIFPVIVDVINKVVEIVGELFISISNTISGVITAIKGIVQFIVGVFTGDWEKAWEGIKNIFNGIWEAIKGIAATAWNAIKLVFAPVGTFFSSTWTAIKNIFTPVVSWFKDIFTSAWNAIKNVFSSWGSFFSGLWNKIQRFRLKYCGCHRWRS